MLSEEPHKAIAFQLGIRKSTFEKHLSRACKKLNVRSVKSYMARYIVLLETTAMAYLEKVGPLGDAHAMQIIKTIEQERYRPVERMK